jgi:hypothetical protein
MCSCRYATYRSTWAAKPLACPDLQVKLIPEWFKARFWDNRQEKKHPWFMFALLVKDAAGNTIVHSTDPFPIHQYYPTGEPPHYGASSDRARPFFCEKKKEKNLTPTPGSKRTDPNNLETQRDLGYLLKQVLMLFLL